jgi:hypothetical protein
MKQECKKGLVAGASSGAFAASAAFTAVPSPFSPYCQLLLAAAELEAASIRPCPT